MKRDTCEIWMILDGKDYGVRHWSFVPRVGDHVMFHPKDGAFKAKVTAVVWGISADDTNAPTINMALERVPTTAGDRDG